MTVNELSESDTASYGMIIGTGLLTELTMDLRFSNQVILQDDLTVPMRTGKDQDQDNVENGLATKASILKLAEERQIRILDANFEALHLDAKCNTMDSLSEH